MTESCVQQAPQQEAKYACEAGTEPSATFQLAFDKLIRDHIRTLRNKADEYEALADAMPQLPDGAAKTLWEMMLFVYHRQQVE